MLSPAMLLTVTTKKHFSFVNGSIQYDERFRHVL